MSRTTTLSKLKPRDVANIVFERWVAQRTNTRQSWSERFDFCAEVEKEVANLQNDVTCDEMKKFTASVHRQLRRLKQKDMHNELTMDGDWVGQKMHGNQLLSDVEEMILCGMLMSQHRNQIKLTIPYVRRVASLVFKGRDFFGSKWAKMFRKRHRGFFDLRSKKTMDDNRMCV